MSRQTGHQKAIAVNELPTISIDAEFRSMSISELHLAFQFFEESDDGYVAGPQPESRIVRAEQALGLTFPPTYREFVKRFGCGGRFGEEFYGVIVDDFENSYAPDAIGLTLRERRTMDLPHRLLIVGATGDGGYYVLDTSESDAHGENPVLEWWYGFTPPSRFVAGDFGTFLWESLRAAAED